MAVDQGVPGRSIPLLSDDPAHSAALVVPNDTAALPGGPARSLYIGVAGDVTVDMYDAGQNITFHGVPAGFAPIAVKKVYATGTTAANIIALW